MITVIAGWFDVYDKWGKTGKKEYLTSHGIDEETGKNVVLPQVHPRTLGARIGLRTNEWIIIDRVDQTEEGNEGG